MNFLPRKFCRPVNGEYSLARSARDLRGAWDERKRENLVRPEVVKVAIEFVLCGCVLSSCDE